MVITDAQKRRGRLIQLEIDGEPAVQVDARTWEESGLGVDSVLDDESLHTLLQESDRRRCKEKALYLLSLRDYCSGELRKKLAPDYEDSLVTATVDRMTELGLIHDEDYARRLARDDMRRKLLSRRRTLQDMQARGLDRDLAEQAVAELDEDEVQLAAQLIMKKYSRKLDSEDGRRKVTAALARYGYSYDTIRRAFRALEEENDAGFGS